MDQNLLIIQNWSPFDFPFIQGNVGEEKEKHTSGVGGKKKKQCKRRKRGKEQL